MKLYTRPTDAETLRYWQRRLDEHLKSRPVTEAERAAIVGDLRREADACECNARLADDKSREHYGERNDGLQATWRVVAVEAVRAGMYWRNQADRRQAEARAWETASWQETLAHIEGRIAYYAPLAAA